MSEKIQPEWHQNNAFDFLRIFAASAVLYSHSYALFGLPEPFPVSGQTYGSLAVALFFAISGFLVCQSWMRDPSYSRFFIRRGLRIFPGLLVVVLLTALVIGPLFTTLTLTEYFASGTAWNYIWQATLTLGSPALQGVFENNPYPGGPNGSLWTLRYELLMYAILAALGMLIPKSKLKYVCPLAVIAFGSVWLVVTIGRLTPIQMPFVWRLHTEFYGERIAYLGAFFFAGATMYLYLQRIRLSAWIAVSMGLAMLAVPENTVAMLLLWVVLPYMAIVFAFKAPLLFRKTNGMDYSYGIYIYAFPVQQSVSQIGSQYGWTWFSVLFVAAGITLCLASASWHFIEKPALSLKGLLVKRPSATTSAVFAE